MTKNGHSKKTESCTIKVPKKKKKPVIFSSKSTEEQAKQILGWLIDTEIVNLVIDMEYKVTVKDLLSGYSNLFSYLAYAEIEFNIINSYFEEEAFVKLSSAIEATKVSGKFQCKGCDKILTTMCKRLWCSSCLQLYHLMCTEHRRIPRIWFCRNCK